MAQAGRFLVVVWDGGGNIVPAAGLTAALVNQGHDVRVFGPASLQSRFEEVGGRFRPFRRAQPPDRTEADFSDNNPLAWTRFISGVRLAEDVLEELRSEPTDVAVVDAFLPAGFAAAEKAAVPAVALVHILYSPYIAGPLATHADPTRPMVERTRRRLEIPEIDASDPLMAGLCSRCALVLIATPKKFDFPADHIPANARYVGPMFDGPTASPRQPGTSRVLVSFSTTRMQQRAAIQRTLDGLADLDVKVVCTLGRVPMDGLTPPPNTSIVDWVPHNEILPRTDVVVTHAGHSTVMACLRCGVPLVCMPMVWDQPFNAERVATLGLGVNLPDSAPADAIRRAVMAVLEDGRFKQNARAMAETIAAYGNGAVAVQELESLL